MSVAATFFFLSVFDRAYDVVFDPLRFFLLKERTNDPRLSMREIP